MRGGVKGVHALLERGWLLCDPIQPSDEAVVACRSRSAALGQMMCELGRAHERIQAVSSDPGRAEQQSSPQARWTQPVISQQCRQRGARCETCVVAYRANQEHVNDHVRSEGGTGTKRRYLLAADGEQAERDE